MCTVDTVWGGLGGRMAVGTVALSQIGGSVYASLCSTGGQLSGPWLRGNATSARSTPGPGLVSPFKLSLLVLGFSADYAACTPVHASQSIKKVPHHAMKSRLFAEIHLFLLALFCHLERGDQVWSRLRTAGFNGGEIAIRCVSAERVPISSTSSNDKPRISVSGGLKSRVYRDSRDYEPTSFAKNLAMLNPCRPSLRAVAIAESQPQGDLKQPSAALYCRQPGGPRGGWSGRAS